MKTALLRAVSHDLRTPLMAILTSAGALARARPRARRTPTARAARTTILGEAERLDRLVEQPARPLAPAGGRGAAGAASCRPSTSSSSARSTSSAPTAGRVEVVLPDELAAGLGRRRTRSSGRS